MMLQSFVDGANGAQDRELHVDFPLENLPWGVFSSCAEEGRRRIGVALGDSVVDVGALQRAGLLTGPHLCSREAGDALAQGCLNSFLALGKPFWSEARATLQRLLSAHEGVLRDDAALRAKAIIPQAKALMHLPVEVGDYTDFYSSRHHAFNVGALFRGPGQELQPNWVHLPVGYHGRASSIIVSGAAVRRPWGQVRPAGEEWPSFGPCKALDFELEMGAVIGTGNTLGSPITVDQAHNHLFGYVLLNDWSARDIQAWEYVPLGPFNGKNFATQISPWIVTREALEPFSCDPPMQDPQVLPYLRASRHVTQDVTLTVDVVPAGFVSPACVTTTNLRHMYWTFDQMVAHHTAGGCNLRPGDILASGTLSGPEAGQRACLLEITSGGKQPVQLLVGGGAVEQRCYLQDGDTVVMRGRAQREGVLFSVGFGECRGQVLSGALHPSARPGQPPAGAI